MRDVKFTDMALWKLIRSLKTVAKDAQHQAGPYRGMRTIPNPFFKPNIMSPENNYDYPEIQRGFHSDEGPEIAIFANKIRYDQSQVGKWVSQQEKLYTEFVFTSRYVKEKIDQHLDMNQHETSEGSFISSETVVVTDKSLNFAARSSFTDPFYIPVEQPFLTGAVNIMSAYELAKLGREVTARYAGQWEEIGGGIVTKFFALDPWKLYEDYTSLYADRWVDNSIEDYKEVTMKVKMSPTLRSIPSLGIRLKSNVPQHNHRKFKKAVRSQYEFGYQQYMIANKAPRNSKNHISKRHDRDLPMAELKSARENSASYYWSKDKKTASSN